jgi:hypothetical protein
MVGNGDVGARRPWQARALDASKGPEEVAGLTPDQAAKVAVVEASLNEADVDVGQLPGAAPARKSARLLGLFTVRGAASIRPSKRRSGDGYGEEGADGGAMAGPVRRGATPQARSTQTAKTDAEIGMALCES